MPATILNCFEESQIRNDKIPQEWRDQSSLDELAEFLQLNWEQRLVLFDDEKIASRQQYLGFTGAKGIRTNNYIGTIVFRGQQLNIFPKVFRTDRYDNDTDELSLNHLMKNIVQWLQYCNKINYPFISISSALEDTKDLRELFVTLYLHYVKSALDFGPFYRYEEKQEELGVIKGHIDFKDYINHKIPKGLSNRFLCTFSEFEFDNAINRIIKYTCKSLLNEIESSTNKKIIRNILIRLNDVKDVYCVPSDCDGIRLSKLKRQYSVILSMSKMFLLNQMATYRLGNHDSLCFLFPTELLFEGFIGGFIEDVLSDKAHVRLQASELTLINDVKYRDTSLGKAFTMKHDILVEHKDLGLFILDTKYKHLSRFEGNEELKKSVQDEVKQSDLYQVIEYAAHRDINSAYLLYPMYRLESEEPSDVVLERESVSGKKISVHVVRLPFVFEENIAATKAHLTKAIQKIFTNFKVLNE